MVLSKMAKQYMIDKIDDALKASNNAKQGEVYDILIALKEMINDE